MLVTCNIAPSKIIQDKQYDKTAKLEKHHTCLSDNVTQCHDLFLHACHFTTVTNEETVSTVVLIKYTAVMFYANFHSDIKTIDPFL